MSEQVNHPQHYNAGGPKMADGTAKYEVIKVIEDWSLGFKLGNALKYILRAPHKQNPDQDLAKARWYLDRAARVLPDAESRDRDSPTMTPAEVCAAWGVTGSLAQCVSDISYGCHRVSTSRALQRLDQYIQERK